MNLIESGMLCSLLPIGVVIVNTKRQVIEANEYIFKYFKSDFNNSLSRGFGEVFNCRHIDGTDKVCGTDEACKNCSIRNGLNSVLEYGKELNDVELEHEFIINERKTTKWFIINAKLFEKHNEPHALISFTDITKRKSIEKDLIKLGITDALTGSYNRRYIIEHLENEIKDTDESHYPLSVVMLDIDDFKNINDQYGHLVGDEVLKSLVKTIKDNFRSVDYIGRYGGDEFLLIFEKSSASDAKIVLDRIQKNFAEEIIDEVKSNPTISAGIVQIEKESLISNDIEHFIKEADKLLYKAKRSGKSKIEV